MLTIRHLALMSLATLALGTGSPLQAAKVVAAPVATPAKDQSTPTPQTSGGGCTLMIGYYKNHAWAIRPLSIYLGTRGGAKTLVVSTQQIGVDVLNQKVYGAASNGITKLYAQLLAAKISNLAGADPSAVAGVFVQADDFLATHNYLDWSKLSATKQKDVLAWHDSLDSYNNGFTGPGHCGSTVPPVTLALACVAQSTGTQGVAYLSALVASGGTPPYTFAITGGSLPPGLALDRPSGAISGTPTAGGALLVHGCRDGLQPRHRPDGERHLRYWR